MDWGAEGLIVDPTDLELDAAEPFLSDRDIVAIQKEKRQPVTIDVQPERRQLPAGTRLIQGPSRRRPRRTRG